MKYTVSVAVDARVNVVVEANNFAEAKRIAEDEVCDSTDEEWISYRAVNAEDENGLCVDY